MRTTLTIRTDPALRERLERRAKAQGKTVSAVAREILEDALDERPLRLRIGHLKGRLKLDRERPWGDALRQRNWRS
jgi:predicted transcriptional regulator